MRNSQLLQLIERFDRPMLRQAQQWLDAPLHNTRQDVAKGFAFITTQLSKKNDGLTKERLFTHCYPGKPFSETQVNHLMSWILEALRRFLAFQEWQADTVAQSLAYAHAVRKLHLDEAFEKAIEKAYSSLDTLPYRDGRYHQTRLLLLREQLEHASLHRRVPMLSLDEMAYHANTAFRLDQLRLQCAQTVAQQVARSTENKSFEQTSAAQVHLYEHILAALKDLSNEVAFEQARALLAQNWQCFRASERREIYLLAINYCIRKINSGQRDYMRSVFDLYREGLENRALFEYGAVSRFTYKNTVTSGLNRGEFDWVRQFIEEYRQYLPARERYDAYSYNLAVWHFWRKEYDPVLTLLRSTDFADVHTNLDARTLVLKVFFEKSFWEALSAHLESFMIFLRRQKSIGYQSEHYSNLIKLTKKLLRLRTQPMTKIALSKAQANLVEEIEKTQLLAEREWLKQRALLEQPTY